MRRSALIAGLIALLALAGAQPAAAAPAAWVGAAAVRDGLAGAERGLALGDPALARTGLATARAGAASAAATLPGARGALDAPLAAAAAAVRERDLSALAIARADAWTALLGVAATEAEAAAAAGDAPRARAALLVRDYRPPTRFTHASADATAALDALARGGTSPAAAAQAVRDDLLGTAQELLRRELEDAAGAAQDGHWSRAAQAGALARGRFGTLNAAFAGARGAPAAAAVADDLDGVVAAAVARDARALAAAAREAAAALATFDAAPLPAAELVRRAGQLQRFLALVPVEYRRGIDDGRVTKDFEIQEAITFRDGAAAALRDLASTLAARDAGVLAEAQGLVDGLGATLAAAAAGRAVADPDAVEDDAARVLDLVAGIAPAAWRDAGGTADFDVIAAALDRLEAAVRARAYGTAEAARLEAYAFFELGPEQRLRGLAPRLFQAVEAEFWYGDGDGPGLAQLLGRRASAEEVAATRTRLDASLGEAERAIGSAPRDARSIVTNTAIIVFREGLEAVLILAALAASLTGARRALRRPLYVGALAATVVSLATWAVSQTLLTGLRQYGEKLEAVVSLVAIGVLLLILNWFFHKVYWTEHIAGLHRQKKRALARGGVGSFLAGPLVGLALLGFTSVYREGFETVLFVQALALEASPAPVVAGIVVGLALTIAAGIVVLALEARLPYKRLLIATGVLVAWVLVVMVGTTTQVLQVVGWLPVTPIDGLVLPYWAGLWLGLYPTWEGLGLQLLSIAFVLGSYVAAERVARRRRGRLRTSAQPPAARSAA